MSQSRDLEDCAMYRCVLITYPSPFPTVLNLCPAPSPLTDATPNLHPHIRELVPLPDYLPVIAVNQLNFMYTSGTIPATDAVYWHVWVYNCMSPEEQAAVMEAWEDEVMTTPASVYDEEVQIPLFTKVRKDHSCAFVL